MVNNVSFQFVLADCLVVIMLSRSFTLFWTWIYILQMAITRSQRNSILFDGSTWARLSDDALVEELCLMAEGLPTLKSQGVFNGLLALLFTKLEAKYGDTVTLTKVKRRIQRIKKEFMEFQGYLNIPGVRLNRWNCHVRICFKYWIHCSQVGGVRMMSHSICPWC